VDLLSQRLLSSYYGGYTTIKAYSPSRDSTQSCDFSLLDVIVSGSMGNCLSILTAETRGINLSSQKLLC
jgi:hypothetical protein